ncbi:MAG: relaxase/mobilization nuclease domain-containing protein, partial [Pseudomonadota bacterium]
MILVGNQRSGASNLAHHLLSPENEHVQVYEISGFASDNLHGAFNEAYAISRGTRCRQYLFSLSLNPPDGVAVSDQDFERAVNQAGERLGLSNQPRAIVFHEKEGRRHCHAVWSRIDGQSMKAIQLSYSKRKLQDLSRALYLEHDWTM